MERKGFFMPPKLRALERGREGERGGNFLVVERGKERGTEKWREAAAMAAPLTRSESESERLGFVSVVDCSDGIGIWEGGGKD